MTFREKLTNIIKKKQSLLCVGLDTDIEKIPDFLKSDPEPLFAFNKAIIDATAEYAAAFKVNTAFYEAYGAAGWSALEKTFACIPAGTLKIADAKRGDIGNTAKMYAKAVFEKLKADAVTLNAYMGKDSAAPFLQDPEKGVFFLCLTSNPGSQDFQYFNDGKHKLYERIALTVNEWNGNSNCGLVVGATHPEELRGIRSLVPGLPFLIPGIGAQGGDLEKSVQYGLDENGTGALFNSSRAIIYASGDKSFARAASIAAKDTRDALNKTKRI
ncbi:orotidine-5'-phosphate decarboxylase [candidate division KSB1 bacterium]|nr:orotidine-5'-phosphate decarboxylase [candidate division KSB1 bacterium]